jgi:predicted metal-dependent hydrolase
LQTLNKKLHEAIDKFNQRKFYECHDLLEDIWFEVRDESRNFYQGLVHLAVGFYHLNDKQNVKGAIAQFEKSVVRLTPYSPKYKGIELENLIKKIRKYVFELKKDESYKIKYPPKINFIS